MEVERSDESALLIRDDQVSPGWERWALLISDVHWDSTHCDRKLLKRHLEQARERSAQVFMFGDTFDAMQGPGDKRASKAELRGELKVANYLDALVGQAAEWFAPYRANIVLLSEGNHEWAAEKYFETNLVARLARELDAHHFAEWGFVRWQFQNPQHGGRTSRTLYFHHGSGGGGPVTRGVIGANRRDAYVQEADVLITGHIHERISLDAPVLRLSAAGKVDLRDRVHLWSATYKQELTPTGYHTRNQRPPKPLGGWWLHFHYDNRRPGNVGLTPIRTD